MKKICPLSAEYQQYKTALIVRCSLSFCGPLSFMMDDEEKGRDKKESTDTGEEVQKEKIDSNKEKQ